MRVILYTFCRKRKKRSSVLSGSFNEPALHSGKNGVDLHSHRIPRLILVYGMTLTHRLANPV
jgi:hypothetical protein